MANDFLYRGVNADLYRSGDALKPKAAGSFSYGAQYGEATYGTGWTYGNSEPNAVLRHQLDGAGFPTAGVSTTPIYERAVFYATAGGRHQIGFVYTINRRDLASHGVREYVVNEFTKAPSAPEDQEVILVPSGESLPGSVLEDIITVRLSARLTATGADGAIDEEP